MDKDRHKLQQSEYEDANQVMIQTLDKLEIQGIGQSLNLEARSQSWTGQRQAGEGGSFIDFISWIGIAWGRRVPRRCREKAQNNHLHYRTRLTHPAVIRGSRSISGYHSDISSNSGKLKTSRRDAKARALSLRWVVASQTDRGNVSAKGIGGQDDVAGVLMANERGRLGFLKTALARPAGALVH